MHIPKHEKKSETFIQVIQALKHYLYVKKHLTDETLEIFESTVNSADATAPTVELKIFSLQALSE